MRSELSILEALSYDKFLYHSTSIRSASKILSSNKITANYEDDLTQGESVSFTSDCTVVYGSIRMKFDRVLLNKKYELVPISHDSELRVLSDITNISKYLVGIDISNDTNYRICSKVLLKASPDDIKSDKVGIIVQGIYKLYTEVSDMSLDIGPRLKELFDILLSKLLSLKYD